MSLNWTQGCVLKCKLVEVLCHGNKLKRWSNMNNVFPPFLCTLLKGHTSAIFCSHITDPYYCSWSTVCVCVSVHMLLRLFPKYAWVNVILCMSSLSVFSECSSDFKDKHFCEGCLLTLLWNFSYSLVIILNWRMTL